MSRRGTALLAALWFLTVAGGIALTVIAHSRLGLAESGNRLVLRQGRWAAAACLAILEGRFGTTGRLDTLARQELGGGIWCTADISDPGARLNVNTADIEQLRAVFRDDSLAAAVFDWIDPDRTATPEGAEWQWYRAHDLPLPPNAPVTSLQELRGVRGMTSSMLARLDSIGTTRGSGAIDVNAAGLEVLELIPGMDRRYAEEILEARRRGKILDGLDQFIYAAPPTTRERLLALYPELVGAVRFSPEQYVIRLRGGVGTAAVAEEIVTIVPTAGRLAVIHREVW